MAIGGGGWREGVTENANRACSEAYLKLWPIIVHSSSKIESVPSQVFLCIHLGEYLPILTRNFLNTATKKNHATCMFVNSFFSRLETFTGLLVHV